MKFAVLLFICVFSAVYLSAVTLETERRSRIIVRDETPLELQHVQVITRHGDRTPIHKLPGETTEWICPNDVFSLINPYPSNNQFQTLPVGRLYQLAFAHGDQLFKGNCSSGQLTEKGAKQHFDLGTQFRALYVEKLKLLSPQFNPEEVFLRSTDIVRTKLSAQSQILGLYPDDTLPENARILRMNIVEPTTEFMYPNSNFCPILQTISSKITSSPEYIKHEHMTQPLRSQLAKTFNVTPETLGPWSGLLDSFTCLLSHNKPIPSKISHSMIDKVFEYAGWEMGALVNNTDFAKYGIGGLVAELIDNMEYSFQHENPKFRLYSGHDTTIGPLLGALGIFDNIWPPYASNIVLELFKDVKQGDYHVLVKYNGKEEKLPGCSKVICPFNEFKTQMAKVALQNWRSDCMASQHAM